MTTPKPPVYPPPEALPPGPPGPPGPLWAAPDHASVISSALDVAAADGLQDLKTLLASPTGRGGSPLISALLRGSVDADYPAGQGYVLHLHHFHHPWTHRGYGGWFLPAGAVAERLFVDGLDLWRLGRPADAVYELGRACHLLADVWVPHHAAGVAMCGHGEYEGWLARDSRWRDFIPRSGGRYEWSEIFAPDERGHPPHVTDWRQPSDWLDASAHHSWPWYTRHLNACRHGREPSAEAFAEASAELVPGAVRFSAGFIRYFFALALGKDGEAHR